MDKVSFKQYSQFMEATDQELNEGFGEFMSKTFGTKKPNMSAIEKLKADREKLKAKAGDKKDEINKKKDDLWNQAKNKVDKNKVAANLTGKGLSQAARGRANEMDWLKNMAEQFSLAGKSNLSESAMSTIHHELQELFNDLNDTSKDITIIDAMHNRHRFSKITIDFLQNMYDHIAIENKLHQDDDFEKIESKMFDELQKDYS